ncbi:MAG: hypothetical protein M3388_17155 [Acidobacteriota bacterium]|nr:hypothetical protein [Acidobacteriota bacterium]
MSLKICKKCKRPFMASHEFCPHCPKPYTWNQESWANVGCLLAMILPLFVMIFFWFVFFFGFLFR